MKLLQARATDIDGGTQVAQIKRTLHTGREARKLRILHIELVITETNAAYNEHCLPMAQSRDITVCTYFKPAITVPPEISVFGGDDTFRGFMRALRSALQANTYDVIHAHTPHVALLFLVATFLSGRALSTSAIVTVHDSYPNYKIRNRLFFLPVFARFARVVCCSQSSFNSFPVLYRWVAGKRLNMVQNGFDSARIDRIAATVSRRHDHEEFNLVTISRLVDIKNPFTVLNAFGAAADGNSRLICIGEGPLRPSLLAMCSKTGLARQVSFTGLLPRERVFRHLFDADLFISASHGEGLPVAVLEAMACGCPVLLSDIPPHREIAGNAGFIPLIDPDDAAGFAGEISRFRSMSHQDRARIGEKCRKLVERRFSLEAMHAGYEAIYTSISRQLKAGSRRAIGVAHGS